MATHSWRFRKDLILDHCPNCNTRRQKTLAGYRYVLPDGTWLDEEPPCPDYVPSDDEVAVVEYLVKSFLTAYDGASFGPGHVELEDDNWDKAADFDRLAARCGAILAYPGLAAFETYVLTEDRFAFDDCSPLVELERQYYRVGFKSSLEDDYERFVMERDGGYEEIFATLEFCRLCSWVLSGKKLAPPRIGEKWFEWLRSVIGESKNAG